MTISLPKKLKKEPLIDAIFEIRFLSDFQASEIIPGFLFSKLGGKKSVISLPAAQLPKTVREGDPNLKFSPTVQLDWEAFSIYIGDKNFFSHLPENWFEQAISEFYSRFLANQESIEPELKQRIQKKLWDLHEN
jgi:hypothetical protein